jgi:hypothetical protein
MSSDLNLGEMLTSAIAIGDKIDVLWNVFVTVHFGIFTLYYLITRLGFKLRIYERVVSITAYSVFLFLNGSALKASYQFLEALNSGIKELLQATSPPVLPLARFYETLNYSSRPSMVIVIHLAMFLAIVLGVLFQPVETVHAALRKSAIAIRHYTRTLVVTFTEGASASRRGRQGWIVLLSYLRIARTSTLVNNTRTGASPETMPHPDSSGI